MSRNVLQHPTRGGTACGPTTIVKACATAPCPTFSVTYSRWSPCSRACGTGQQQRLSFCRSSQGGIVASARCSAQSTAAVAKSCNTKSCNAGPVWFASRWSMCSRRCTGVDGVVGIMRRNVTCSVPNAALCVAELPAAERQCSTRGCVTFHWHIGQWSACSQTCGGGTQTRAVHCVASDGTKTAGQCSAPRPIATTACATESCDPCAAETCSGHGACFDGMCRCSVEYSGRHCQIPASCSGSIDKDGACCIGQVMNDGRCCSGVRGHAKIAADGACCASGSLDACGVCDGDATSVDALGACCSGVLGEDGLCCNAGTFDTCGVCDGDDSSCSVAAALSLPPPRNDTADAVAADPAKLSAFRAALVSELAMVLEIAPARINITSVHVLQRARRLSLRRLTLKTDLEAAFEVQQPNGAAPGALSVPAVTAIFVMLRLQSASERPGVLQSAVINSVQPHAECGNGVCEAGEGGAKGCLVDCPIVLKACPSDQRGVCSGRGRCVGAFGVCECFTAAGYVGSDCSDCAPGLELAADGTCAPRLFAGTGALVRSTMSAPRDSGVQDDLAAPRSSETVVVATLCSVCCIVGWVFLRRHVHGQHLVGDDFVAKGRTPVSSAKTGVSEQDGILTVLTSITPPRSERWSQRQRLKSRHGLVLALPPPQPGLAYAPRPALLQHRNHCRRSIKDEPALILATMVAVAAMITANGRHKKTGGHKHLHRPTNWQASSACIGLWQLHLALFTWHVLARSVESKRSHVQQHKLVCV